MIREQEQFEILHCAFRYALGRSTYVTGFVADAVLHAWPQMTDTQRRMIQTEIAEAITKGRAGQDTDIREWQRILWMRDVA